MIVADTNLVAYLLLEGEHTEAAERVLERDSHWIAPQLWRSELRNILATYVRQDLLTLEGALRRMELAEVLLRGREYAVPSPDVLRTATESGSSGYDSEFVVLAREKTLPLVTSDRRLLTNFPDTAVSLRDFVAGPEP